MRKNIAIFAITLVSLLLVYIPTFDWMYARWTSANSYSSHGFIIPLISIWLLWYNRSAIASQELKGNWWGVALIALGLTIHFLSGIARIHFTSGFSFPITITGAFILFTGVKGIRWGWFPLLYLYCMVPFPLILISFFTLKLKLIASEVAVFLLNFVGIICIRDGSIVSFTNGQMVVGDVCSGLRSLVAMIALSLPFAYITRTTLQRKALLVAILLPLAMVYNILRVFFLGIVTYVWGSEAASGTIHDMSGMVALFLNIITMLVISRALEKDDIENEESKEFIPPTFSHLVPKATVAIVAFIVMAATTHFLLYQEYSTESKNYSAQFPKRFASWYTIQDYPAEQRTIELLETKDLLTRLYAKPNTAPVLLALVVSENSNRKVSHPPEICYKGAGCEILQRFTIPLEDHNAVVLKLINNGDPEYVIYWYKFGEKFTGNYYYHQANALMNFFTTQKGGAALIRTSIKIGNDPQKAFDTLRNFANDIYPSLRTNLP